MESNENPYKLFSALYRLGLLTIIASFLLIPGMMAYSAGGQWAAAAVWAVAAAAVVWSIRRYLHERDTTAFEALTASRPDVADKPLWLMLVGALFAGSGIFAWSSTVQTPKGEPVPFIEKFVFGAVFFGLGSGVLVMGASAALIRWSLRRELADLERRIAMRPDSAALQLELAAKLADQVTLEEAIPALDKAIELDPRCAEAYVQRGRIHWMNDRYKAAIADLTRAIELDPNNADAYMYRSMAYEDSDQPELAKADEERSIELQGEGE
jgi:tetratricopeptide (TPR) repeat protein